MKVKDVIDLLNDFADEKQALDFDNSGLQIGSPDDELSAVMLCVDVTDAVIREAVEKKANMIISHHPFLFHGVKKISESDPKGKMIRDIIKAGISVYSSHTCADAAVGGLNDYLADAFRLKNTRFLDNMSESILKVSVSVPKRNLEAFEGGLFASGFGRIGSYKDCSYQTAGVGTFTPLKGSNPAIGEVNAAERVEEVKIEGICLKNGAGKVIDAIYKYHPYECPAFDLIPVHSVNAGIGIGICGDLEENIKCEELISRAKKIFHADFLRVSGNYKGKTIKRIALCAGSGSSYIQTAISMGAEAMITADCKMNDFLSAVENGFVLICPTHFSSEYCFTEIVRNTLLGKIQDKPIFISEISDSELII